MSRREMSQADADLIAETLAGLPTHELNLISSFTARVSEIAEAVLIQRKLESWAKAGKVTVRS